MAVEKLPKTITKELLYERAQERSKLWDKLFYDPNTTAETLYEEMCCSVFSGEVEYDFPDLKDDIIKYQYKGGSCFFMIDGIEVEVMDLREMRKDPTVGMVRYSDVCIPSISYTDSNGNFMHHPIPNAWLYGSTSEGFDEGKPVHEEFIKAAREYIKEHNITPELQKYLE